MFLVLLLSHANVNRRSPRDHPLSASIRIIIASPLAAQESSNTKCVHSSTLTLSLQSIA